METLLAIKRWQLRMFTNGLRYKSRSLLGLVGQLVGIGAYGVVIFLGLRSLFTLLLEATVGAPAGLVSLVHVNILSSLALATLLILFVTGLKPIHDTLFEAGDLSFLLSLPISARSVFAAKFVDTFLVSLGLAGPVLISAVVAYGVVHQTPASFYVLGLVTILLGVLLFHSLVVLLLLLVMRYVPGQVMKQTFVVLTGLAAVSAVLISQIVASNVIEEQLADPVALFEGMASLGIGEYSYLPHVWITK